MTKTPKNLLDFSKRQVPEEFAHFDVTGEYHENPVPYCLACGHIVEYMLKKDFGAETSEAGVRVEIYRWNQSMRQAMMERSNRELIQQGTSEERMRRFITGFPATKAEIAEVCDLSKHTVHNQINKLKPKMVDGTGIGRRPGRFYFDGEPEVSWIVEPEAPKPEPKQSVQRETYLTKLQAKKQGADGSHGGQETDVPEDWTPFTPDEEEYEQWEQDSPELEEALMQQALKKVERGTLKAEPQQVQPRETAEEVAERLRVERAAINKKDRASTKDRCKHPSTFLQFGLIKCADCQKVLR
jgi:predicted transcriptional regulator